jgi:hypothetical protein
MIKKYIQAEMDKRQPNDINLIIKVLDRYNLGLSGEVQEDLVNRLHDAFETIILTKIDKL